MMLSLFRMILSGHDSVFFHSVAALPRCDFCASWRPAVGKARRGNGQGTFLP
jgi:hypothetical protein